MTKSELTLKLIEIVGDVNKVVEAKRSKQYINNDNLDEFDQEIKKILSDKLAELEIDDMEDAAASIFDQLEASDDADPNFTKLCEVHQFLLYYASI